MVGFGVEECTAKFVQLERVTSSGQRERVSGQKVGLRSVRHYTWHTSPDSVRCTDQLPDTKTCGWYSENLGRHKYEIWSGVEECTIDFVCWAMHVYNYLAKLQYLFWFCSRICQ